MGKIADAVGFVFCLGGLNPLCWTGCAYEEKPEERFDNSPISNDAHKLR